LKLHNKNQKSINERLKKFPNTEMISGETQTEMKRDGSDGTIMHLIQNHNRMLSP